MPRDVAMQQPRPRVIRRERNSQPATPRQKRYIATRWILPGESRRGSRGVELPVAAAEDVEVVAVEVDGVGDGDGGVGGLLDDPVGPLMVVR